LLELEQDLAVEIARRVSRSSEDREVRVVAYASIGLLRASVRVFVVDPASTPVTHVIDDGMHQLEGLYAALKSDEA